MLTKKTNNLNIQKRLETLEKENKLAQSYLDIAGVLIVVLDKNGMVKIANKKTCDVLGYSAEEIIGKNWFTNFLPAHTITKTQNHIAELFEGKIPDDFNENPILTKDNQERLILWHNAVTKDSDGKINVLVSSGEDITEMRRIQNELLIQSRNSEYMYLLSRSISDTTDLKDLIYKSADILSEYPYILGGKIFLFAEAESLKISEEIIFGKSKEVIKKDKHLNSSNFLYDLLESKINCIENTVFFENGKKINVQSNAYKMNTKYETHGILVVFCDKMDATLNNFFILASDEIGRAIKRKKIELELTLSEKKFNAIFNFVPDALTISRIENSVFLEVNKGFEELMGLSRERVINNSAIDLNLWVIPQARKKFIEKITKEGVVRNFITPLRKNDGKEFTGMFSAVIIYIDGIKCLLASLRDVTDQIKFRDEILSTNELLEKITQISPLYISLYDVNNDKIIYLNKSLLQSFGYSKDDLKVIENMNTGQDSNKYFYHPEDDEKVTEFTGNLRNLEEGNFAKIEFRLKDSNNKWQWVQQTAAIFQKENNKLPLITVNVFENITERKHSEEKLIKQNNETELLYEAGKQISSTLDLELIYDRMYKIISRVADCSELIVVQYEAKTQEIIYKYLRGRSIDSRVDVSKIPPIPLAPKGFGIVSQVIRTGESIIINDYMETFKKVKTTYVVNQTGDLSKDKEEKGTETPKSAMIIPIKLENKILGAVQIHSKKIAAYTMEQLRFVESLMNQVALANRNATVFEQAKHEISERKSAQEKLKKSEKDLRQFAESVPDVLFRLDVKLMKFNFLSPVIETMLGYLTEEVYDDPITFLKKICFPDDFETAKEKISDYIKFGRVEAPLNIDSRVFSKDGRIVWVRNTIKFEYRSGNIYSVIGAMSDITKEKVMEVERRTTDEKIIRHQSALLELSRIDSNLNESMRNITENAASALKISRASIWYYIDHIDQVECKDLFITSNSTHHNKIVLNLEKYPGLIKKIKNDNTIISGSSSRDEDINRFAKDILLPHGTIFSLISPFRYKGKIAGSLCLESDNPERSEWTPEELDFAISATGFITLAMESHERKLGEEEIKKSLKDKEMLLREIHHRVKNNLQVISSLLYLQAMKSDNPALVETLIESQNRVKSMVMIHEKLYKSQNLSTFNYAEYIKDLTSSLFRTYILESQRINLKLDVGDVMLDTDTAVHCGLIINELVSNSMKHAFPVDTNGEISIYFNTDGGNNYTLIVSDDGIGIKDIKNTATKNTLGMQLIYTLVEQLDGSIDVSNTKGTKFTINFSLKEKI